MRGMNRGKLVGMHSLSLSLKAGLSVVAMSAQEVLKQLEDLKFIFYNWWDSLKDKNEILSFFNVGWNPLRSYKRGILVLGKVQRRWLLSGCWNVPCSAVL